MTLKSILICAVLLDTTPSACGLQTPPNDDKLMNIATMNGVPVGAAWSADSKWVRRATPLVAGTSQMSGQILGDLCKGDYYQGSQVELAWQAHAVDWTKDTHILCSKLQESKSDDWMSAVAGETSPSTFTFSTLCKKGQAPQLLEPLAGVLRSPHHFCQSWNTNLMDVDYLVLADQGSANLPAGAKRLFFDAGGSKFGHVMGWFTSTYAARGLEFDHIFVWEYQKRGTEAYWEGVPTEVRRQWEPKLTFYDGVGVTADPMDKDNNVLERIKAYCSPHDFCAFKLDIDTPSVELPLVQQLLTDSEAQARTDEFFFEHHVSGLMETWWLKAGPVNGTFADSYDIFSKLRSKGVRAHSWV